MAKVLIRKLEKVRITRREFCTNKVFSQNIFEFSNKEVTLPNSVEQEKVLQKSIISRPNFLHEVNFHLRLSFFWEKLATTVNGLGRSR